MSLLLPFSQHYADKVLKHLKDGVPFLSVAAGRAGVLEDEVAEWVANGLIQRHSNAPMAVFARQVHKIQSDYIAEALVKCLDPNTKAIQANNYRWILERLKKQLFMPDARVQGPQHAPHVLPPAETPDPEQLTKILSETT